MNTAIGTNGNDVLQSHNDFGAYGLGGDDVLYSANQSYSIYDVQALFGGTGNDTYNIGRNNVVLIGDIGGNDTINVSAPFNSFGWLGFRMNNDFFGIYNDIYDVGVGLMNYSNPNAAIETIHFSDNVTIGWIDALYQISGYPNYVSPGSGYPWDLYISMLAPYNNILNQLAQAEQTPFGFNEDYYDAKYADVAAAIDAHAVTTGGLHYNAFGINEGRSPNLAFDQGYYFANNPDVAAAVAQGVTTGYGHFLEYGQFEGRQGSAEFNADAYLAANPDVAAAIDSGVLQTAFQHFAMYGQYEGRPLAPEAVVQVDIVGGSEADALLW